MSEDIIEHLQMASPEQSAFFLWIAAGIALLMALSLVFWLCRSQRRARFVLAPLPPPGESALHRLRAILPLIEQGLARDFAQAASEILRHDLMGRLTLEAPQLSTEEFLRHAEGSELLQCQERQRLAEFLYGCDRVKFARHTLDRPQMEALFFLAESLIQESPECNGGEASR